MKQIVYTILFDVGTMLMEKRNYFLVILALLSFSFKLDAQTRGTVQYNTNNFAFSPTNMMKSNITFTGYMITNSYDSNGKLTITNTENAFVGPRRRKISIVNSTGSSANILSDVQTTSGTLTHVSPTATEGTTLNYVSAAVINNPFGSSGTNPNWRTGYNLIFRCSAKLQENSQERIWYGYTDQTAATMQGSSNPAGNYAAFRYDSTGDTNFKCITKDNVTQNVTDSGKLVDTSVHLFEIFSYDGAATILFRIDGVNVATNVSNLPTSGSNSRYVVTGNTLDGNAKTVRIEFVSMESDR